MVKLRPDLTYTEAQPYDGLPLSAYVLRDDVTEVVAGMWGTFGCVTHVATCRFAQGIDPANVCPRSTLETMFAISQREAALGRRVPTDFCRFCVLRRRRKCTLPNLHEFKLCACDEIRFPIHQPSKDETT